MGQRIPVTLGNIALLALKPFRPGRLALVCEGGEASLRPVMDVSHANDPTFNKEDLV